MYNNQLLANTRRRSMLFSVRCLANTSNGSVCAWYGASSPPFPSYLGNLSYLRFSPPLYDDSFPRTLKDYALTVPRLLRVPYPFTYTQGKARLGQLVNKKTSAVVCVTGVRDADQNALSKIAESARTHFNNREHEVHGRLTA